MFRATRMLAPAARRTMATAAAQGTAPRTLKLAAAGAGLGLGAAMFSLKEAQASPLDWLFGKKAVGGEWDDVRAEIKEIFEDNPDNGPFFMRLAWHCAGSYDKNDNTGGSNGATMRFPPEADHGGNAGLGIARDLLEDVKAKHPNLTYADIYTFAGVAACELMGGPTIEWTPGRTDFGAGEGVTPDGRLPDAALGPEHLRDIFYRMGFSDQEIVALSGAHSLGFCHDDRSGFVGAWTETPHEFSNKYFKYIKDKKWRLKEWSGPAQFEDEDTGSLMMLPTDMALLTDTSFRKYLDLYAANEDQFRKDFAKAFSKLLELGVPR